MQVLVSAFMNDVWLYLYTTWLLFFLLYSKYANLRMYVTVCCLFGCGGVRKQDIFGVFLEHSISAARQRPLIVTLSRPEQSVSRWEDKD